jgi:hypothetical protein
MVSEEKILWQLEEFRALRQELDARAQRLYSLSALQLTISGAIFAFAITQDIRALLLLIPFSSYLLCGRYYDQHKGGLRIARYIRERLDKDQNVALGWEKWISETRINDRIRLKRLEEFAGLTIPLYLLFPVTPVVALLWALPEIFGRRQDLAGITITITWILGLLTTLACFYLVKKLVGGIRKLDHETYPLRPQPGQ